MYLTIKCFMERIIFVDILKRGQHDKMKKIVEGGIAGNYPRRGREHDDGNVSWGWGGGGSRGNN